ncbi:MAG: TonB-dependent receptor [Cyclobacteriaceae bacterium]|nr:MAG: TonB-dependent receptor [Cyclobacteriaceae bacterium]
MQKALLLFVFISTSLIAAAQTGSITGTITDSKTKEPIIGGSVLVQGTQIGTSTDIEGKFTIKNLKVGTYNLQISYIGYKTTTVPDVVVEATKVTDVVFTIEEESGTLEEVVITGTRSTDTDFSVVRAIRESKLVVSGVSAEQIARLPDKDAAQIMQRVPGITIVDSRFVMVRGVPERYNQVMINNAIAPSTEIDRRSFSFDLIPAGALDQLLIYKSGAAELPGDFAGGVIQMSTKQATNEKSISFGLNFGYRVNTTFNDFKISEGSSTDFLGFDNGFRDLPSNYPSSKEMLSYSNLSPERAAAGKTLRNNFDYNKNVAPTDYGFNFGIARNFKIGNLEASNLTTLNYSTGFVHFVSEFARYQEYRTKPNSPTSYLFNYKDDTYGKDTKVNLIHNWLFKIGDRSKIEFKNFFVQLGESTSTFRSGENPIEQPGKLFNNNAYHYLSRTIYTGQLQGTFRSPDDANIFTTVVGFNYIGRNEPDYRRFRRYKTNGTDDPFTLLLSSSSSPIDAGRFYSNLNDKGFSHALNYERKFGDTKDKRGGSIKVGYSGQYKTRDFSARYISYLFPGTFTDPLAAQRQDEIITSPIGEIFTPENMFTDAQHAGLAVQEGTRPSDRYTGKNLYLAGYVGGSVPVGKFDLSGGFRIEYNRQELSALDGNGAPIEIDNPITSPLPFLNVAFNLTERTLLRAAYSRTVNRPEFRELAPFSYYQFEYDANAQGNDSLKTAIINNFDLRWEMYPNEGEMISLGGFYKSFTDPIEVVLVNTGGLGQNFSYKNAPTAYSVGVELEVKKSLAFLSVAKIIRNTTVNLNASVIKSEVDLGQGGFQKQKRPMQGQSPYVINAGIYYSDQQTGLSVNVGYNIFGSRIAAVGSVVLPTWYELPRNVMDVQVSKTIKQMEIKLNVSNLLNAKYRVYQDDNYDDKMDTSIDQQIRGYKTGQLINLGFNWKFLQD